MSEIKEGEYIRTTQGFISKVEYIEEDMIMCESVIYSEYEFDDVLVDEQMKLVTKHSFNIIDLIEKDDYVNGRKVFQVGYNFQDDLVLKMSESNFENFIYPNEIKTIVTKEMMKSVEYRIERDMETN